MEQGALTDGELDRLAGFLEGAGELAMPLEAVDGYFAALISGPVLVDPMAAIPKVWGDEDFAFESVEAAEEFTALLLRHWHAITRALVRSVEEEDGGYWPLVFEDEHGLVRGNDWALGFMEGVEASEDGWAALFEHEEIAGSMTPILILAHEHDEDPEHRPAPIADAERGGLIEWLAASVPEIFAWFAADRVPAVVQVRREGAKTGRNALCPCGSGRKFKRCCGATGPAAA